ncbi:MAG: ketoacyl-ACP synthase III [Solirubrobacteraceae bacterium]|nr:ketoacyl-ACP synthase III [Solirubrobacteraceae bacterium]
MAARILGTGSALPEHVETNDELCASLAGVTPEDIVAKSGIHSRRIAGPDDTATALATDAARHALENAGVAADQVGLVVACTYSADYVFPPASVKVAAELGCAGPQCFDLQANCTGFVNGLTVAADRLAGDPELGHAIVIGVELQTRFVDRTDGEIASSFADGAAAAVLGASDAPGGLLGSAFATDASNWEAVRLRAGGSSYPMGHAALDNGAGHIEQAPLAPGRQAITHLPGTIRRACEKADVELADIDLILFHQANRPLIDYLMRKLRIDPSKTHTNVEHVGNTGAASVGIVLDEAARDGRLAPGAKVLLAAAGAGFTFGASVWEWA